MFCVITTQHKNISGGKRRGSRAAGLNATGTRRKGTAVYTFNFYTIILLP